MSNPTHMHGASPIDSDQVPAHFAKALSDIKNHLDGLDWKASRGEEPTHNPKGFSNANVWK